MGDPISLIALCLQPIFNRAYDCGEQQLKPICGFQKEAAILEGRFPEIEESISKAEEIHLLAILEALLDPERKEIYETVTREWLHKLKAVYYDVGEIIDKWKTVDLMSELDRDSKKVLCVLPYLYSQRLRLNREIALSMRGLTQKMNKFDELVRQREHSSELIRKAIIELKPETASSWDLSTLHGRVKEKALLVERLLNRNGEGRECLDEIISIVGMGGIGKTALALLAFHDEAVISSFPIRIWVSVPYFFDLDKIAKLIIEKIEGTAPDCLGLDHLLGHVDRSVRGKRIFLVLDDVWTVDPRKWIQLKENFRGCHSGSRILVTTQKYDVAKTIGTSIDCVFSLELLPEENCWSILGPLAKEANEEMRRRLDEIRSEFMCKCNGLPLIAQVLENQMRFEKTRQNWDSVLQSELGDVKNRVFVPYLLNYYDLSSHRKHCFTHCAVFPRNYEIERDDLVDLWMSEGYFCSTESPKEECINCFKILAGRYMFQDLTKDHDGEIIKCKMHNIVHAFAHFLTKHEYFITEVPGAEEQKRSRRIEESRHLTLLLKTAGDVIPTSVNKKKDLRSLFVVRSEVSTPFSCDFLVKLKGIRTLHMQRCNIGQLPEEIDKLVHLRYLNLSGNSLRELPDVLCNLFNLMTLRLKGCRQLQRLPEEMGKLKKLQNLYVEGCDSMEALPSEISKLQSLRTLDMFVVPSANYLVNGTALRLQDLNELKHLQGHLHIFRSGNMEIASIQTQSTQGYNIVQFTDVKINFTGSSGEIGDQNTILETLGRSSRFRSLEIIGFQDTTLCPSQMDSFSSLKRVALSYCGRCELLPPLGKLVSLESLQIDNMGNVETVGLEFFGIQGNNNETSFPSLKDLRFNCLHIWRTWKWTTRNSEDESNSTIMPCLSTLQISRCDNLEALPGFLSRLTQLHYLTIQECQILKGKLQDRKGHEWLKISHIQNIQIE